MQQTPVPTPSFFRQRLLPLLLGAPLPFAAWGTFEVLRGKTWGLIGGPFLNWLVMMGMSLFYASLLVAAGFAVDHVLVRRGQNLRGGQQFGAGVATSVVALPVLALMPLNEANVPIVALWLLGGMAVIVGLVRAIMVRLFAPPPVEPSR